MAINNAQLFQQVQESLEVERKAYGELSRTACSTCSTLAQICAIAMNNDRSYQPGTLSQNQAHRCGLPEFDAARQISRPNHRTIVAHKVTSASEWTSEEIR